MTKQPWTFARYRGRVFGPRWIRGVATAGIDFCTLLSALAVSLTLPGPPTASAQTAEKAQTMPTTQERAREASNQRPTKVELESWRRTILSTPRPKPGCFTATFPAIEWREVQCKTPPNKPYPPKRPGMTRTDTVGGAGPDFSVVVAGHITDAEGSFDSVTNVTSECTVQCPNQVCPANPTCGAATANQFSLQLNSKTFTTQTCNASPDPNCLGWEQFVYSSSGNGFIQYWLENYGPAGTACPTPRGAVCAQGLVANDGWCPFQFNPPTSEVFCVVNAAKSAPAPAEVITSLGQLRLTGAAAGGGATTDSITVWEGNTPYTANGNNYFPDLGNQWQEVEFNVFGDGNGDQAVFNNGATVAVRTAVSSGTTSGPGCDLRSFTGESTNLTLVNTPPPAVKGTLPALLFSQTDPPPAGGAATCADATSVGDTHLTTFDGLYYDFQASGDYVLAQDGPDFVVQTRQASGAPTWPNAAVNKAVATQMGKTRVALYIEPTRLVVDGAATNLADGQSLLLPTGVQVTRNGNVYVISSEDGDRVRATLNSTWIDVKVGLGHSPRPRAGGLLGNPGGNGRELLTSNGVVLTAPVLFSDLYHPYAESWRVLPKESLFTEETNIQFGIPTKPFYASDLTRKEAARALAACKAAGIKNPTLLDSCTLDTTVLNNKTAVKVFVQLPPPRHVIKPGAKDKDRDHDCDCDDRDRDHDRH